MGVGGISAAGYEAILKNPELALKGATPGVMYHWSPSENDQSIAEKGLDIGSWLSDSPENALRQARVLGNTSKGTLHTIPVQPGDVVPATTTLGREPVYKSTTTLVPRIYSPSAGHGSGGRYRSGP